MRIALAQINPCVGDFSGNFELIARAVADARAQGADLVALPELAVCGYPPEDLLFRESFLDACEQTSSRVIALSDGIVVVFGAPVRDGGLRNAAIVAKDGRQITAHYKHHLPTYGVFDEDRYFTPGDAPTIVDINGTAVGVTVCEDAWHADGPMQWASEGGAEILLNINASPYNEGKHEERVSLLTERATQTGRPIAYVNCWGGQDELLFDGGSCAVDADGAPIFEGPTFCDNLTVVEMRDRGGTWTPTAPHPEMWRALECGLADYARKNGFSEVHLGISGGIDSSLVATLAADALGPQNVTGLILPSRHSSDHSVSDARALAQNLGIVAIELSIEAAHSAVELSLDPHLTDAANAELARENVQARLRGLLWMAMSNATGSLALACGNKSEMAVGYATLYGDMSGGLAPIKDVPKTDVYALARWRNGGGSAPIPESVLTKAPSAELRPGQRDSDSLPDYEVLDPILELYVERDLSAKQIVDAGFDPTVVDRVIALVDRAEYKRRQAPPGLRVTTKAFGRDRRIPITNRFRDRS